jgi:hypothetical protein
MRSNVGRDSQLSYFTHHIDGADYGGWYRDLAPGSIEVLSVGLIRTIALEGRIAQVAASEALEEFVRVRLRQGLPIPRQVIADPATGAKTVMLNDPRLKSVLT